MNHPALTKYHVQIRCKQCDDLLAGMNSNVPVKRSPVSCPDHPNSGTKVFTYCLDTPEKRVVKASPNVEKPSIAFLNKVGTYLIMGRPTDLRQPVDVGCLACGDFLKLRTRDLGKKHPNCKPISA